MKRPLLTHFFWVSSASYASNALRLVRGLALAKILGPGAFGLWTVMRVMESLSQYLQLGSRSGTLQLAAAADGRRDAPRAAELRSTAAGMSLLVACLIAAVTAGAGSVFAGAESRSAWLIFAVVILLSHVFNFSQVNLRSRQSFGMAGFNQTLLASLTTLAAIAVTGRFGLEGFLSCYALAYGLMVVLSVLRRPAFPAPSLNLAVGRDLIHAGFPIMAGQALGLLLWNADKLVLWSLESAELLGIYAIQASFTGIVLLLPNAIVSVLHPHLMREMGRRLDSSAVRPYLSFGSEMLALAAAPVVCSAFLALHLPIRWWLSEYIDAVAPGRLLMLAAYFSMVGAVPGTILITLSRQRQLCVIRAIALFIMVPAGVIAISAGFGLVGLAGATSLGLLASYFLTQNATVAAAALDRRTARMHGIYCLIPLGLGLTGLAAAYLAVPDNASTLSADILLTLQRIGILSIFVVPWALWRSLRLRLFQRLNLWRSANPPR